jgi:hypothetical protein
MMLITGLLSLALVNGMKRTGRTPHSRLPVLYITVVYTKYFISEFTTGGGRDWRGRASETGGYPAHRGSQTEPLL